MENFEYAYKGKRIHIKRIVCECSCIIYEYDIIDNALQIEFGKAKLLADGSWENCVWFGPQEPPIQAGNVRDLA